MSAHGFYSERRDRNIIRARGHIRTEAASQETGSIKIVSSATGVVKTEVEPSMSRVTISAIDLYVDLDAVSPIIVRTKVLLGEATELISESIRTAIEGDFLASDLHVQALRGVLRKLFMCRAIGDGFGAVIDALISALENNRGLPLDLKRLRVLRSSLLVLGREPFLSFGAAIKTIQDIEHVGFSTSPPGFEQLADWLTT